MKNKVREKIIIRTEYKGYRITIQVSKKQPGMYCSFIDGNLFQTRPDPDEMLEELREWIDFHE